MCLLNQTHAFAPVQVLSWVQQAKRKMELFSACRASHVGGCRVWIEPVTAALRPMLHGDRWLHRACRMAKRFKGALFQFLYSQLAAAPEHAGAAARALLKFREAMRSPREKGDGVPQLLRLRPLRL